MIFTDVENLIVMAGGPSRCSSLQWTAVIEAILNAEEVDVITLINVVKRSSKITSDVESKAREMISFKILERLFDPDHRPIKSARCAQTSGVSFDYSKRCEDVLRDILGKMNDPNIWDESEKSKWNVKRFIEYKRPVMDMHVESKTSFLTSLNQLVSSKKLNPDGTKARDVNGAVINNQQNSPCIDDNVCQDTSNDGNRSTRTGALNGEDGDNVCHDLSYEGNKITRSGDLCDEDGGKVCHDISNDGNKRTRIGDLCGENGDKVCYDISNEGNKRTRSGDLCNEDGDKVCHEISSERNKRTRGGDLCGENGDKVCHGISNEGNKRTRIGDLCGESGDKVCQGTSNEGNRSTRTGSFSEDDCYQKELNDINAKKQVFFSSICKDREGFTHLKDVNRCMKCKKGGQLLICSSNTCSFVFHESCLVSSTPFDNDSSENFYCPFCKCSQSISDYWVAKKKTSLARNYLAAFCKGDNKNIEPEIPNIVSDPDLTNRITEISGKEGCNERSPEKERADVVNCSRKFEKPTKSFTDLFFPQRRRVPVPWTQSEEETLKKWVEKFMSCNNIQERSFPWSKILELGASTFQKSRIPVDLKDKWRNMQKAKNKSA